MPYTDQEKTNILINAGLDPTKYFFHEPTRSALPLGATIQESSAQPSSAPDNVTSLQKKESTIGEAIRLGATKSALPTASGLAAGLTTLAAVSRFTPHPVPQILGLLAGGAAGAIGGQKVQDEFIIPQDVQQRMSEVAAERPFSTFAGEMIPSAATFNPITSLRSLGNLAKNLPNSLRRKALTDAEKALLANAALNTAVAGGSEAYRQYQSPEPFSPWEAAYRTLGFGLLGLEPTGLGRKIGFKGSADFAPAQPGQHLPLERASVDPNIYDPRSRVTTFGEMPETVITPEGTTITRMPKTPDPNVQNYPFTRKGYYGPINRGIAPKSAAESAQAIIDSQEYKLRELAEEEIKLRDAEIKVKEQELENRRRTLYQEDTTFGPLTEGNRASQEGLAIKRGFDIQPSERLEYAGAIQPAKRLVKYHPTGAKQDTISHEALGHGFVEDLLKSLDPSDVKLGRRLIEMMKKPEGLSPKDSELVARLKQKGFSDEDVAKELLANKLGKEQYKRSISEEGSFKQWWNDVKVNFKGKLGLATDEDLVRHILSRYEGDAPYGTRSELMPLKADDVKSVVKHSEDTPIGDKEYEAVYNSWEEHAAFIGKSLFPDKDFDTQLRVGKNAIEALAKKDPMADKIIGSLINRGALKAAGSEDFRRKIIALASTLREKNFGTRYQEGESIKKDIPDNWRITVQEDAIEGGKRLPTGYVQIDKVDAQGKDFESTSMEQLKAEGYNVPDFKKLKQGQYSMKDVREKYIFQESEPIIKTEGNYGPEIEGKLREASFNEGTRNIKAHDKANENAKLEAEREGQSAKLPAVTKDTIEADEKYLQKIDEVEAFTRPDVERNQEGEPIVKGPAQSAFDKQQNDPKVKSLIAKVNSGAKLTDAEVRLAERLEFPPGTTPKTAPDKFREAQNEWNEKIYNQEGELVKLRERGSIHEWLKNDLIDDDYLKGKRVFRIVGHNGEDFFTGVVTPDESGKFIDRSYGPDGPVMIRVQRDDGSLADYEPSYYLYLSKDSDLDSNVSYQWGEPVKSDATLSSHGFVPAWRSQIDKVRTLPAKEGKLIAEAVDNFNVKREGLEGTLRNEPYSLVTELKLTDKQRANVSDQLRYNISHIGKPVTLDAKEAQAVSIIEPIWQKIISRFSARNAKINIDLLNNDALNIFHKKQGTPEYTKAINDWVNYVTTIKGGNPADIKDNIVAYVKALNDSYLNPKDFSALGEAKNYPIPDNLREHDVLKNILKFGSRASQDLAYQEFLLAKPDVAAALNLPRSKPIQGIEDISGNPDVKNLLKFIHKDFAYITAHPRINALSRVFVNSKLGAATGIRDIVQIPVFSLPYIETIKDVGSFFKAFGSLADARVNSLRTGVRRPHLEMDRWFALESTDEMAGTFNKIAEALRKWQGRETLEQAARIYTYSLGKEMAKPKILEAVKGDKNAIAWLKKFSTGIDQQDIAKWGPDELNQVAANFTTRVQGSYDARGLPAGAVDSQYAPFFRLANWSIEKSNVIYKDVFMPMFKQRNFKPFLMYTLGSVLTGTAIREINEMLSGKKDYSASMKEAISQERKDYLFASFVNLLQMAGYAGIMSDLARIPSDVGIQRETPRGPVTFPMADFLTEDLAGSLLGAKQALDEGADPADVAIGFAWEGIAKSVQNLRLADNWIDKEGTERKNMFRDMRVFNKLSGENVPGHQVSAEREIVESPEKKFKRTKDLGEAVELLPKALEEVIKKAGNDPYKLMSELRGLKINSYQTMPDPSTQPLKFYEYITFLQRTQGKEAAAERLQDWILTKEVNKTKSEMVPSI